MKELMDNPSGSFVHTSFNDGVYKVVTHFLDAPLTQAPASIGPKSRFLVSYTPNPIIVLH